MIREAIRRYLDEQADLLGSRKHFQKSFQDRMDKVEAALGFHLNIVLFMVHQLTPHGEKLLERALQHASKQSPELLKLIREARDEK